MLCAGLAYQGDPHVTRKRGGDNTDKKRLIYPYPEAMHQLGNIGRTKLEQLCDNGHLKRVHIGRRAFITAESLEAYVNRLATA